MPTDPTKRVKNSACPCGSGLKHKKCCFVSADACPPEMTQRGPRQGSTLEPKLQLVASTNRRERPKRTANKPGNTPLQEEHSFSDALLLFLMALLWLLGSS